MRYRYKLLILDLDGTLTNKDKQISKRTKEALFRAMDAGVSLVLASGRPSFGIMPLARELEMETRGGYILSYNGGSIIRMQDGKVLYQERIKREEQGQIFDLIAEHRLDFACSEAEEIFVGNNISNRYMNIEAGINKMNMKEVAKGREYITWDLPKFVLFYDEANAGKAGEEIGKGIKAYPKTVDYSVAQESDIAVLKEKERIVKAAIGEKFEVYRSEPFFLEILPKGIDKAKSIARLLDILGLVPEEVIACGDGFNDISMIRFAGLGVAMENAVPAAKEAADYITFSNDAEGVAHVVEKFILESGERKELDYYTLEGQIGFSQDDFQNHWMRLGGCAAVTAMDAAIFFDRKRGSSALYPYDKNAVSKEDYLRFSRLMRPYLRPRWTGIDRLSIYVEGVQQFLKDRGCTDLGVYALSGHEAYAEAEDRLCRQIDRNILVPMLLLRHRDKKYHFYVWHWFNLAGYEKRAEGLYVKAVTYGHARWLHFQELWESGYKKRGGLILFEDLS